MEKTERMFLVNFDEHTFKDVTEEAYQGKFEEMDAYCKTYESELREDQWLFAATYQTEQDGYLASSRATFAAYMEAEKEYEERKDFPFYIDVAEHDERVLFDEVVNKTKRVIWSDELNRKYGR